MPETPSAESKWLSKSASQTRGSDKKEVQFHYDISNDFFKLWQDPSQTYSCAYFERDDMTLEEAQVAKKAHIARKLRIEPGMRVLDIGSGWGGLSIHLAKTFGAQVTGVTLSKEQLAEAERRAEAAGVADKTDFRLMDYRHLDETFDRVVVVGMMEHVGQPQYPVFMNQISKVLAPDGVALVHTIGRTTPPGQTSPFIHKYIFPGGYIPAMSEVMSVVEKTDLLPTDIEVWRDHYIRTMQAWKALFEEHVDTVREMFDERFVRMWRYYLTASEMSFSELGLVIFQFQLAHNQHAVPTNREYLYP